MTDVDEVALMRRGLVDRVMRAVRTLGAATSLDDALQRVTDHVVGLLGFESAALSVLDGDGLVTRAVAGPSAARVLLGQRATRTQWEALLAAGHADRSLVFVDHRTVLGPDAAQVGAWWEPGDDVVELPENVWHSGDTLLAPTRDEAGDLVAVLSADLAVGALQDTDQRTALALFAAEAGSALLEWEARAAEEERRRTAEQRLRIVWQSGLVAAAVLDAQGRVLDINERGAQMLGYAVDELTGVALAEFVPGANLEAASDRLHELIDTMGAWVQERELRHRDGRTVWTSMHAAATLEGSPLRPVLVVQWIDITARQEHAALLARELDFDAVTDLPNRRSLERHLADLFGRAVPFGVLELDLDGFKSVLDGLGHAAADRLLEQVARRLERAVPAGAMLSRDSGDEFVVVVAGEWDLDDLSGLADTVAGALRDPFDVDGVSLTVQASVGVSSSRAPEHQHPVDVLREADEALNRAKRRGRSRVEVFDPGFDAPLSRSDFELELDLRLALHSTDELEPHFQSVISLTTGTVVGYESLLRWRHPRLGVLLPSRFLPVAERSGLAGALGNRMLELMSGRVAPEPTPVDQPWISVNVSAAQLGRGTLLDAVTRLIDTTFPGSASTLQLEITETSLLDASPAVIDELYAAVELGARLALDDFGTGYSSLTLLRDLPVTSIKIDRSFIAPIAVDVRARTIVQHTIELCQGLGMTTVAEGIETHEQLAWLQTLGCDHGQGFLIDRPTPWPRRVD